MKDRYGPWAVIAGASEGIGAAFAAALAKQGLDLVLVARRPEPLAALAESLPVRTVTVTADLATSEGVDAVLEATADLEVGLVICNAAYSPIGPFLDTDPALTHRALRLNCAAPLALAHAYLPVMALRRRGGFVIMSSLAGAQGSPGIAVYAATKAFGAVLAEGLWDEMRHHGVDVITAVAGAVATPGLAKTQTRRAPGTVSPAEVADAALRALGSRPRTVPGGLMKVSSALISRLLPKRAAIAMFARASRDLEPPPPSSSI